MTLDEGQVLFYEGDLGQNLYVVRNGELQGTNTRNGEVNTYGPGALLGELSLIKNEPSPETVTATEECELLEITPEVFNKTLEKEPVWFKSIIQFLTGRLSIAQLNKHKSDKIKALPSLLYILDSLASCTSGDHGTEIPLARIIDCVHNLFNSVRYDIEELLQILEELDILKVQGTNVLVKNAKVIHLLYESIRFRAQFKKAPRHHQDRSAKQRAAQKRDIHRNDRRPLERQQASHVRSHPYDANHAPAPGAKATESLGQHPYHWGPPRNQGNPVFLWRFRHHP